MSTSANILSMQRAIINYIESRVPKDQNKAQIGIVSGSRVFIGNKSYDYIPTVDLPFRDGSRVACILPEKSNSAAVVGVL